MVSICGASICNHHVIFNSELFLGGKEGGVVMLGFFFSLRYLKKVVTTYLTDE